MDDNISKIRCKAMLENMDISALRDISEIGIDDRKTATQRMLKFIDQTRNPYLFKVGKTPIKVVFPKKYAHVSIEEEMAKIVSGHR